MDLCMEIPTGVMVSPASLVSMGSARASHSSHLEASPSILAKRRIHVVSSLNFNKSGGRQRWVLQYRGISFKCNVITNLIDEKGVSSSIESVFLACSADKEENTDLILNATANSVSHDEPIGAIKLKNSATSNDGVLTGKRLETRDDNRETVLKPLREVLGKAGKVDKLETENMKNPAKLNDIEIRSNAKQNGGFKPHRPVKTNNVWRRGDPMKNIHNEVREVPRISIEELEEAKSPLISKTSEQDPSSANVLKLQKPIPVSPTNKFASKEPIADLITSETVLATTKPVKGLLSKSKERWTRSSVPGGLQNGMIEQINVITPDEDPIIHKHHSIEGRKPTLIDKFSMKKPVVDSIASEVRKPTLIDKFSIKKPAVDSNASEGELTLTKLIKGPPTKFKEEHKKKFSVDGDLQKEEVDDDDVDIIKEDPIIQKPHNTKPRRPILIDNFSSKKSVGDSNVSEAVIASTKSVDGLSSKLKVEHSKTSSDVGGLHKRLAEENDAAIIVEDALETDVPISAVSKGKKWTKASRKAARHKAAKTDAPVKAEILEVGNEGMYIEELAYNLAVNEVEIIEYLCSKGIKSETVRVLDKDMVKMICKDYDVEVIEAQITLQEMAKKKEILDEEDLNMLEVRPPVITIMGHVDHGKTTLLDCIRNSKVVASEFGGITQGIGAYKVQVIVDSKPQYCVFLDTPGHEAFGAMRARGARVTDITIIVVAADDGVCPQTTEAIAHAKAAEVPIVIAINKMDKDGADPDRVMQELSHAGLMPEEWGGHIPMVKISALKNENVDQLLETVMLVAEMQELKANPHRKAKGTCIEAGLEKQRGPVSTFIVQNGTLRKGDIVVCGEAFGKARALFDDRGIHVDEVGPSMAVQVIGLSKVPIAGDEFEIVSSLDLARKKAETCAESLWASRLTAKAAETKITLSSLASAVSAGKQSGVDRHQLNIILKADVQGSIEAIKQALHVLPQDNVTLKFLHKAPGGVSASDVDLAVVAKAIIFGFNVKALGSVKKYADQKNVEIRLYRVIYDLIDEMRKAMEGLLESAEEQIPVGVAKVRATFSTGSGRVAGCMITEGKLMKGCSLRVVRNGMTIYTGVISSLRRIKEVVEEVGAGLECGVGVDTFSDWAIQDVIEAFQTIKKRRTLEEASASVTAALAGAGIER